MKNTAFGSKNVDRSIGAILIDSGRLSPDDTERVLQFQREEGIRFGEAGVKLGLLTEADILFALSLQFDYPFLSGPARPVSEDVVVAYRPFGNEGERLRSLRSQLQLRWFDEVGRNTSLAVVGPHRGEGRSYLAANLAVSFAQAGERTLLIDADLHNASQHRYFKLENGSGLSNLLAGQLQDGMVQFVAGIPGLAVLPSGPLPPNPQELLARPVFQRILEQSASTFSVVIVDTPAMEEGIDATLLARATRAALAVARTNLTRTEAFAETTAMIADIGAKVVGSVLVDVEPMRRRRGKAS
ncbi:MAG: polysaccharide biosynthesis tyrosine autokinase [Rubrivivax sp.]|jgi:receptor protein-tyrosine kinase|nr:polysaccharide biosynthesis tyrosine autokinase [Rubrivivax sp.]